LGRKQVRTELVHHKNDKLMTIASPAARPATPRIRMFGPRCYWQPHAPP